MQGLTTLIFILAPMFVGFLLPKNAKLAKFADKSLGIIVLLILFIIGLELSHLDDVAHSFGKIALYLTALIPLTIGSGIIALFIFDKISPCPYSQHQNNTHAQALDLASIATQFGCLGLGFLLGQFAQFDLPNVVTSILLMILLLFVGILLKNANIALHEVLLNRRGLIISGLYIVATLASGFIFSLFFKEVEWSKGVALASSFGWYSLSGTIMTQAYGAMWGSVAVVNDLVREILAFLCIPALMRHSSSSAIGLAGVTGLDFTLPTLQRAGGNEIVPIVISFGFIVNVLSPVLMVVFSKI